MYMHSYVKVLFVKPFLVQQKTNLTRIEEDEVLLYKHNIIIIICSPVLCPTVSKVHEDDDLNHDKDDGCKQSNTQAHCRGDKIINQNAHTYM